MTFTRSIIPCLLVGAALVAAAKSGGKWATRNPMLSSRTEVAAAETGGKIYVIGGFGQGGELVEEYDPAGDRWQRRASLPRALHHTAAAAVAGKIYVVGGFDPSWGPVNYAVGGVGSDGKNTGANEEYDPLKDRWTKHVSLPTVRDHLAVGVVDGKLYAIGGRMDGNYRRNLAVNEEYDPTAGGWRPRASMPTARSGIAAAVLGGRIFVFGGESPSGTFNQTESYDPATNNWISWAAMPTARHGLGAALVGSTIYVLSGGPTPGGSFSSLNEAFTP